jgi:hypothetical protein
MSRTVNILSSCKIKLKQIAGLDIQDPELIFASTLIQNQLMRENQCVELAAVITFVSGIENYSILSDTIFAIRNLFPSWTTPDRIEFVENKKWHGYKGYTGSFPRYWTQFNNEIYFSPIPSSTDHVDVWAYKLELTTAEEMSVSVEPKVPKSYDLALIYGICSEFDPSFLQRYEYEKQKVASVTHEVNDTDKTIEGNW